MQALLLSAFSLAGMMLSGCATFPKEVPSSAPKEFAISAGGGPIDPCYSVAFDNGQLVHSYGESSFSSKRKIRRFRPTEEQWQAFWREMESIDLWKWKEKYAPPENIVVCDGTRWYLRVSYQNKTIKVEGDNTYPSDADPRVGTRENSARYNRLIAAARALVGNREFF